MYDRIYNLIVEGETTGGNLYKTGKRIGKHLRSKYENFIPQKLLPKNKSDQFKRIVKKLKNRHGDLRKFHGGLKIETPYTKQMMHKYYHSRGGKEKNKKYYQSDAGKESLKKYEKSDKGKERRKKYGQTEKGKAVIKKHDQRRTMKKNFKKFRSVFEGKTTGGDVLSTSMRLNRAISKVTKDKSAKKMEQYYRIQKKLSNRKKLAPKKSFIDSLERSKSELDYEGGE